MSLLKALRKSVKGKCIVDGVEKVIDLIIGVKQGDVLGPELFIFFMATVMATRYSSHSYILCVVRCKSSNFQLTGRRPTTKGDLEIEVSDIDYANDKAFTFETREDCERIAPLIVRHRDFVRRNPAFFRLIPYTPVPPTAIAASGLRRLRPTVYELLITPIEGYHSYSPPHGGP